MEILEFKTMQMCIRTFFCISQENWKQSDYLSIGESLNKMWYIHSIEYQSAVKESKPLKPSTTKMNLNNIMPSKKSQTQRKYIL